MKRNDTNMSYLKEKILSPPAASSLNDILKMEEMELLRNLKENLVVGLNLEGHQKLFIIEESVLMNLVEKVAAIEDEEKEDEELSARYETRLNLPEEEWIELPPGKSIIEHYKERKNKNEK